MLTPRGSLWPLGPLPLALAGILLVGALILAVIGARGLGSALTATPVPREGTSLVSTGVYRWIRHPIYTGLLAGGLGLVAIGASPWHVAEWLALAVLLSVKARWEERMLTDAHPEYAEYAARTGRFVPGVGRRRSR